MNASGDAAEQVVKFTLEGAEVAAKIAGEGAKGLAILLLSVLKQEKRTKGKVRLTNMIKSGKPLTVFSVQNKDLKKFTEQAKKYGVMYNVLREKNNKSDHAQIDIIAREEDSAKIQRIIDRFDITCVDKASIVAQAEKDIAQKLEKPMTIDELYDKLVQESKEQKATPTQQKTEVIPQTTKKSNVKARNVDEMYRQLEDKPPLAARVENNPSQSEQELPKTKDISRTPLEKESVHKKIDDAKKAIRAKKYKSEKEIGFDKESISERMAKTAASKITPKER